MKTLHRPLVLILVGLPGSGKSAMIPDLAKALKIPEAQVFDDYKARRILNSRSFNMSQHFQTLKRGLPESKDFILSDIDFCRRQARLEAISLLSQIREDIRLEWLFFRNDPEQCRSNILSSSDPNRLPERIKALEIYTSNYTIPKSVAVIPVFRESHPHAAYDHIREHKPHILDYRD